MEPQEPVSSTVELTIVTQTSTRASTNKRRCRNKAEGPASTSPSQDPQALALPVSTIASENAAPTGRKRKSSEPSAPIRRSPRLSNEQSTPGRGTGVLPEFVTQSDQVTGHWQPPPPSPLAASQRPFRIQLSRAKRNLHGAGPRAIGSLYFLQIFTAFLQSIGEQPEYSATGQGQVIFFETDDLMPKKGWRAISSALDRNQPTTTFLCGNQTRRENPLINRSSGIGPINGIEP
jgi:hypothetical protein